MVYVRDAHPTLGLVKGKSGTVVETLERPYPAYLVEFIDDDGATKAEAASRPIGSAPSRLRREPI